MYCTCSPYYIGYTLAPSTWDFACMCENVLFCMSARQQSTVECIALSISRWYTLGSQLLNSLIIDAKNKAVTETQFTN